MRPRLSNRDRAYILFLVSDLLLLTWTTFTWARR